MCVIIARDPGIEVPFNKLKAACITNSDGFGLSVIDRGKLVTQREFSEKGNDPERVMKLLEDAKDHKVYLHLRFRTAGTKGLHACHPFQTLTLEEDGIEVSMMHNGTMSEFSKTGNEYPDTYWFNEDVLKPLLKRSIAFLGPKQALNDPFVEKVLKEFAGVDRNKIVIYDSEGNDIIINKKAGKDFEGWWASNEYSFNEWHRTGGNENRVPFGQKTNATTPTGSSSTGTATTSSGTERGNATSSGWNPAAQSTTPTGSGSINHHATGSSASSGVVGKTDSVDAEEISNVIYTNMANSSKNAVIPPEHRDTFCEVTGLTSLHEACFLSEEDILEGMVQFPDVMCLLVMDLLWELYLKRPRDEANAA